FSDIFSPHNSSTRSPYMLRAWLMVGTLSLLAPFIAQATANSLEVRRAELNRLLAEEWEYTLRTNPELATNVGDYRYNDKLSDFSEKAILADLAHEREALAKFEALDVSDFPEQEKLNDALMVRSLRETIEGAQFKTWEMPVSQFGGVHHWLSSLPFNCPFRNAKDYQDYLSRLRQIPR